MTPQGGQAVTYSYNDPIGRLKTITAGANIHTYDYVGNSGMIDRLTRPNASFTQYEYNDPLKRLTAQINRKSTQEIINSFAYTYNSLDLKDTETVTNGEAIDTFVEGTTTYTPNILNQTTATTNPNRTYAYDSDGNMTGGYTPDGYALTMAYDAENRMKSAEYTDGGGVLQRTEYIYAGDSFIAIKKTYANGILTGTTRYVRAGFLPVQERDGSNAVTREYTWGLNMGGGIGGLLNLTQGGQNYAYLYDGKGNVTALIDSAQAVAASYAYDPFGVLMKKTATLDQPYMFSTKEYDSRTGKYYYGFRFYDPITGKWTTRDPLGEAGGWNLYGVMNNSAMNWIDPDGLDTYRQNREFYAFAPEGRAVIVEVSHTFIFTTDTDGNLKHTYSWGNVTDENGNGLWKIDRDEDIAAAKQALANPFLLGQKVGDSSLDEFIDMLYHEWENNPNHSSRHPNLWIYWNCKTEATRLIKAAKERRARYLNK